MILFARARRTEFHQGHLRLAAELVARCDLLDASLSPHSISKTHRSGFRHHRRTPCRTRQLQCAKHHLLVCREASGTCASRSLGKDHTRTTKLLTPGRALAPPCPGAHAYWRLAESWAHLWSNIRLCGRLSSAFSGMRARNTRPDHHANNRACIQVAQDFQFAHGTKQIFIADVAHGPCVVLAIKQRLTLKTLHAGHFVAPACSGSTAKVSRSRCHTARIRTSSLPMRFHRRPE